MLELKAQAILVSIVSLTVIAVVGCRTTDRKSLEFPVSTIAPAPSMVSGYRDAERSELEMVDGFVPSTDAQQNQLVGYQEDAESVADTNYENEFQALALETLPTGRDRLSRYARPVTSQEELPADFEWISLDEAIRVALFDARILRSLSANVVRNAPSATSIFDSALQLSDPNFGVDAALAQFDATLTGSAIYANNDDFFNNPSTTGNANEVQQNLTTLNFGWNKVSQAGTQLSFNNALVHDDTTNPTVLFPSSWEHRWEATVRQPLMQGRGTQFNQIAGPNSRPGFFGTDGVLISRSNQAISVGDFQRGVRDLILEIINAYWQLDLAYRNYETIRGARDASLITWNVAKARFKNGLPGGEADREAQARGQYYQFELQLDRALNAAADSSSPGVLQAEANLRRLLNLPQAGGGLLRPSDVPTVVGAVVDWEQLSSQAISERIEVQQQSHRIHQRELELIAARNFTKPRLDALATYRNSGLGNDLINGGGKFAGALNEAWAGNYDEWEFGFAFDVPVGVRQARAGVRNARLQVSRERATLVEMQQQILHDLGSALRSVDQTVNGIRLAKLRRDATKDTMDARVAAYEADAVGFEDLLDAQQRFLEASLELHNAMADRELAQSRLYSEAGSLLNEFQVFAN